MIKNGYLKKNNAPEIFPGLSLYWPADRKVAVIYFFSFTGHLTLYSRTMEIQAK